MSKRLLPALALVLALSSTPALADGGSTNPGKCEVCSAAPSADPGPDFASLVWMLVRIRIV